MAITAKFKGGETYEIITNIFDITPHTNYVEFLLNGYYHYYEFNNDHTIREHTIWNLNNLQLCT